MMTYARLPQARAELNQRGESADDPTILDALRRATATWRTLVPRIFHTEVAHARFNGNGEPHLWLAEAACEPNRADLWGVESLTVDGVALMEGTDFVLFRESGKGARRLDHLTGSWPYGNRNIVISGRWSVAEILEDTGLECSVNDSDEAVAVAGLETLYPGDTLYVEDEQMLVRDVAANQVTVTRGFNGTTAAEHTDKAIRLRRYPADVEGAVAADAARWIFRANQGYPVDGNGFSSTFAAIHETRVAYSLVGAGW